MIALQLQIGAESAVTALLVLVQTAVEFMLGIIPLCYPHSELDFLGTKLQLLSVQLNKNMKKKPHKNIAN